MLKSLPIGRLFSLPGNGHTYNHSVICEYSLMVKIRSRDAILLVIPLIILVPVVFKWKLRSPSLQSVTVTPQSGYVAQVKSVQVEPATAREVYGGYDTRVTIVYKYPPLPGTTWWSKPQPPTDITILGGGAQRLASQATGYDHLLNNPKRIFSTSKMGESGEELVHNL